MRSLGTVILGNSLELLQYVVAKVYYALTWYRYLMPAKPYKITLFEHLVGHSNEDF